MNDESCIYFLTISNWPSRFWHSEALEYNKLIKCILFTVIVSLKVWEMCVFAGIFSLKVWEMCLVCMDIFPQGLRNVWSLQGYFPSRSEKCVLFAGIFSLKVWEMCVVCRDIFPQGLPQQFSLIITYRTRRPPKTSWDIIRITDQIDRTQLAITLNPAAETLELTLPSLTGGLQTVLFSGAQVVI